MSACRPRALLAFALRRFGARALICLAPLAAVGLGQATAAPRNHHRRHVSAHKSHKPRTKKRHASKQAPAKRKPLITTSTTPPSKTTTTSAQTPISAMNGFTLWSLPSSEWAPQLALMESKGIDTVRSDAPWAVAEPQPYGAAGQTFNFSTLDRWVQALAQHHLTWLPVIDDTPWWAKTCTGMCPPLNMNWYATFARAVAARYGAGGTFWGQNPKLPYEPVSWFEIWNEENGTQFWWTGPSAAHYAMMYADARAAIKTVDPTAQVMVGGLGARDAGYFVEEMLIVDPWLRGNIDGFGLHPYETTAAGDVQDVVTFRRMLDSLGEGSAPIEITEFGWQTGAGPQESSRASMIGKIAGALSHSNCGIGMLAPYTWFDPQDSPSMGLVDQAGPLPSANAWFAGLQAAARAPATTLCS